MAWGGGFEWRARSNGGVVETFLTTRVPENTAEQINDGQEQKSLPSPAARTGHPKKPARSRSEGLGQPEARRPVEVAGHAGRADRAARSSRDAGLKKNAALKGGAT